MTQDISVTDEVLKLRHADGDLPDMLKGTSATN